MFPCGARVDAELFRDIPVSPYACAKTVGIHVVKLERHIGYVCVAAINMRPDPLPVKVQLKGIGDFPDVAETENRAVVGRIEVV